MQFKTIFHLLILISIIWFPFFLSAQNSNPNNIEKPRNIILLIGDGMGINHIYQALDSSLKVSPTHDPLNILTIKNLALVKTNSANGKVTDSGAAGTAIATGSKTNNQFIGMDSDTIPLKSVLKYAEDNGLATGLVATSDITHATPASFIASVKSRYQTEEIAKQFLNTDIDVFIGGGLNAFAERKDGMNYVDSLKARQYKVITSLEDLRSVPPVGKLAGLLYPDHPPKKMNGRDDMLSVATGKAIDILDNDPEGFFLMIEGSQIDWGGHDNDLNYIITEVLDFDKAVGIALDFAKKNEETLVIVTADHETGGLTLIKDPNNAGEKITSFSTTDHSAAPVPLFAFGPGAEQFKGLIDNTDIFRIMMSLYNFKK